LSVRNYFHPGTGHRSRGRTARDNRIIPSKRAARRALSAAAESGSQVKQLLLKLVLGGGSSVIADAVYW